MKLHEVGEGGFGAHVVREDEHRALARLETDERVGSDVVVAAFEKARALGASEDDHSESGVQILALC